MKVKSVMLMLGIIAYSFSLNAQNKATQCEQFYKDAKSAYDKGDYEVALIFFNRCKTEGCTNADFQIYIDVCNMKLGKKSNTAKIDSGIEINGVVWATCNVDVPGKFVANPYNYGQLYTWEDAQNVCPTGWRLPTDKELESLINSGTSVWSELNRVKGRYFGSGDNRIFLPATGFRGGGNERSNYWSSVALHNTEAFSLLFNECSTLYCVQVDFFPKFFRFAVRCVCDTE